MGFRVGSMYFGSPDIQVSTANQEIIQANKPTDWTFQKIYAYRFSFTNNTACHIKLNGSANQIYLASGQGFEMDMYDSQLFSFVIVEAGVSFSYIGGL